MPPHNHSPSRLPSEWSPYLRLLLTETSLTRRRLVQDLGLSPASITHHTRWLLENGICQSEVTRMAGVKRPVELLSLNPQSIHALTLDLSISRVQGTLVNSLGTPLLSLEEPLAEPSHREVFRAISQVVQEAELMARAQGKKIDLIGMSIPGQIDRSLIGTVFHFDDIPDWDPCSPSQILPALKNHSVRIWTRIHCKLQGAAKQRKLLDRFAYVEFRHRRFHFATLQKGKIRFGALGTSGPLLHQTVARSGPPCYCGREGCLAALLKEGIAGNDAIAQAFLRFFETVSTDHILLDWEGDTDWMVKNLKNGGLQTVDVETDPEQATREGLAFLAAEAALQERIDKISKSQGIRD